MSWFNSPVAQEGNLDKFDEQYIHSKRVVLNTNNKAEYFSNSRICWIHLNHLASLTKDFGRHDDFLDMPDISVPRCYSVMICTTAIPQIQVLECNVRQLRNNYRKKLTYL